MIWNCFVLKKNIMLLFNLFVFKPFEMLDLDLKSDEKLGGKSMARQRSPEANAPGAAVMLGQALDQA